MWERGFHYYTYNHAVSNHFWCSMTNHPICHNCLHSGPHLLRSLHPYGTHYQVLFCLSWSRTLIVPAVVIAILAPILIQISAYPSKSHPDSARNCNDSPKLTSKVFEEGSPQSCLHRDRPACLYLFCESLDFYLAQKNDHPIFTQCSISDFHSKLIT